MSRSLTVAVGFLLLAVVAADASAQYRVTTEVTDFVVTKWELECPDGRKIDLTEVDLTEEGIVQLVACLNDFEAENGLLLESKTKVKNGVVEEDRITTEVDLTEEQAQKLCDIVDDHQAPAAPAVLNRPRVVSEVVNGVLAGTVIVFPDGKVLDLNLEDLDAQTLQGLLDLIQQFEEQNGVHVTGETQVLDGQVLVDRILNVTHLYPEQLQQILDYLQNQGYTVDLTGTVLPVVFDIQLKGCANGMKGELRGALELQRTGEAPPAGQPIQVQIVAMGLMGVIDGRNVGLMLPDGLPGQGALRPDLNGKTQVEIMLDFPVLLTIPELGLNAISEGPLHVEGKMKLPATKDHKLKGGSLPLVDGCDEQNPPKLEAEGWVIAELKVKKVYVGKSPRLRLVKDE